MSVPALLSGVCSGFTLFLLRLCFRLLYFPVPGCSGIYNPSIRITLFLDLHLNCFVLVSFSVKLFKPILPQNQLKLESIGGDPED